MIEYVKPVLFMFLLIMVSGAFGGIMAANRGRRFILWCLLCALMPPLLLVIHFSKPRCEVEGKFRRCSSCGELIRWRSAVCKYCKREQTGAGHINP